MRIRFDDYNPHRPAKTDEYIGDSIRLLYENIYDGTNLIAPYIVGDSQFGDEDGWLYGGNLYTDVHFTGSN